MTTYKNERSRKKLLVPVVALLLCAAAMVGLGYAALVSDVTNTNNVITSDGLTVTLTDESDGLLSGGGFVAAGDILWESSQENETITYTADAVLGGATLKIHVSDPTVTKVTMKYVTTWKDDADTTYNISTKLSGVVNASSEDIDFVEGVEREITLESGSQDFEFTLVLSGQLSITKNDPVMPYDNLTYDIKISVTQA